MTKYRVFGDKLISYYTIVTADNENAAWEFATNNDNLDWFEIPTDSTIEVHFVATEQEDTLDLEDGYTSIENDIVISDKSDI